MCDLTSCFALITAYRYGSYSCYDLVGYLKRRWVPDVNRMDTDQQCVAMETKSCRKLLTCW